MKHCVLALLTPLIAAEVFVAGDSSWKSLEAHNGHRRLLRKKPAAAGSFAQLLRLEKRNSTNSTNQSDITEPTENPLCISGEFDRCLASFTKQNCPWTKLPQRFSSGACKDILSSCQDKFLNACPPPPGAPVDCCSQYSQDCVSAYKDDFQCDVVDPHGEINGTQEFHQTCGRQLAACHPHFQAACAEVSNCDDGEVKQCVASFRDEYDCNWETRPRADWFRSCTAHLQRCRHKFEAECKPIPHLEQGLSSGDPMCVERPMVLTVEVDCESKNASSCYEEFGKLGCPQIPAQAFQAKCGNTMAHCFKHVTGVCSGNWNRRETKPDPLVPRRPRITHALDPLSGHKLDPNMTLWSYKTPMKWQDSWPTCGGEMQSPINIDKRKLMYWGNESMWERIHHNALGNRTLRNTGHGLQVNGDFGHFTVNHTTYHARQFNFHFPSEHQIDGKAFAGELQIIHQKKGATGSEGLLIFAVLFVFGEQNQFLQDLGFKADNLPLGGINASIAGEIDPYAEFQDQLDNQFFRYDGSMTAPPCTEGVKWYVFEEPAEVSKSQVRAFKELFPNPRNNRPTQWLNDRLVEMNVLEIVQPPPFTGKNGQTLGIPWFFWLLIIVVVLLVVGAVAVGISRTMRS
mmetsp:Transcript_57539/g.130482  ORF Transcript_57539/g.130482 Transcript_57539/m.130482 type:complete len:628 (-) Transcript_57539:115-1998(-)